MGGWLRNLYVDTSNGDEASKHMRWFLATFGLVLFVAGLASLPFSISTWATAGHFIGLIFLVGTAGFASGGLLGFLFGVPRANRGGGSDGSSGSDGKWLSNTNLEEVSDWLTKMVVGVSLVELGKLNGALTAFSVEVDYAVPGIPNAGFAASLVLIGSAVSGFMLAYLKSRTSLMLAFDALGAAKAQINRVGQTSFVAEGRKLIQYPLLTPDPAAVSAAADMLKAVPPKAADSDTLRLVGFAQAILRNFAGAAEALEKASQIDPDPDLKVLAARAAAVAGDVSGAEAMLPTVRADGAPLSTTDFETELARMFVFLYDAAPGSAERAIEIGDRLAADPSGKTSPRVWLYLASAYGQSYTEMEKEGAAATDLKPVRDKALDAVRKALELDRRNNLPVLQMLYQIHYPGKPADENDLEVFAAEQDPDFAALLGPASAASGDAQTDAARPADPAKPTAGSGTVSEASNVTDPRGATNRGRPTDPKTAPTK